MTFSSARNEPNTEISGFIIERTSKRMKQAFQQMLKQAESGITVDQWIVLQELEKEDGMSQNKIADRTFKDRPTITRILDLLDEKGLVKRVANPIDRRAFSICLTAAGKQKIKNTLPIVKAFRAKAWQGLPPAEMKQLTQSLNTIFNNLI